jgi:uncharacterized protein YyaL (SSP411 family)
MSPFRFSPRPNRAHEIQWREWGDAAFAEAKTKNVPVLLAISAVWCHWCHVMDETSYSAADTIKEINERFVPIRVDNDERPDVNRRYNMGGWPTTAFLTPDGEVIHGATYIPPEGMYQTVIAVSEIWRDKRDDIEHRVAEMKEHEAIQRAPHPGDLSSEIVDHVAELIRAQYDPEHGGFGREPKFPQTQLLRFLLNEHRRHPDDATAQMLRTTLDAMAGRGMYDGVEGGFFRYATTREWNTPHYEKMLEDNAELLTLYGLAHELFPDAGYDGVAADVIQWMDTVLFQPETGLWSGSQDADEHYFTLEGDERAKHEAPFVDRTLYTSWNALAAGAYMTAGRTIGERRFTRRGWDAISAIDERLRDASGALCRYDAGEGPRRPGLLGDAATFLALLTSVGDVERATALAERMRAELEDAEHGGFFDAPAGREPGRLGRRERPIEENAVAARALLDLAVISGDERWREVAVRTLRSFVGEYRGWGQFAAAYANVVARALRDPVSIVVVGQMGDPDAEKLWRAAQTVRDPDAVVQHLDPDVRPELLAMRGFPADRTAAYVCVGTTCSAPLSDEGLLRRELEALDQRAAPTHRA